MNDRKMICGGREYLPASYYMEKYDLTQYALRQAEKNGLPCIKVRGVFYYNEQEFHDYYAGRIGNDVEEKR